MKSLIAIASVVLLGSGSLAVAEDVESESGGKSLFQKLVEFSCSATTCYQRPVFKVPKSKTLTLTHLSCFSSASNQPVMGVFVSDDDTNILASAAPTSNGGSMYIVNQDIALTLKGGHTLSVSSNAYAAHSTRCTVTGVLK